MRPLFRRLLASCSHQNSISSPPLSRPRPVPWSLMPSAAQSTSTERVSSIVNELSGLTLLEIADLTDVLKTKLGVEEMPVMGLMMPGMGFGGPSAGGAASAKPGAAADAAKEKTAFDLQLDSFDAASKIKVIKEVRAVTSLGLKEAKDLVEKAPGLLKKGVTKEEAEQIVAKLKEAGAKVSML